MSRKSWLEARQAGVGGSETASLLSCGWETPYSVYLRKRQKEIIEGDDNERMLWGRVLEGPIADEWARQQGVKIQKRNCIYQSKSHPSMLANIDRLVKGKDGPELLEIKTAGVSQAHKWGTEDSTDVPASYMIQVQHYLHVLGLDIGHLVVLIGGQNLKSYRIEKYPPLIERIVNTCGEFWEGVQSGKPPAPVDGSDISKMFPVSSGNYTEIDPKDYKLFEERVNLATEVKAGKSKLQELDDKIKILIARDTGVLINGSKVASFKEQTRTSLKSEMVKAMDPDLWERCTHTSTYRTLRWLGEYR